MGISEVCPQSGENPDTYNRRFSLPLGLFFDKDIY